MKRPLYFVFLAMFLVYMGVTGAIYGLKLTAQYGGMPGILGVVYGWAAIAAAIGLWAFRSWALQATAIWAITAFLRVLNMQYGLNGVFTLQMKVFIPTCVLIATLLAVLIYYVRKGFSKGVDDSAGTDAGEPDAESSPPQERPVIKTFILPCALFLGISFLNFAITVFYIEKSLVPVAVSNAVLNLIPAYFLANYFIAPLHNRMIYAGFLAGAILLSALLVIPYGMIL